MDRAYNESGSGSLELLEWKTFFSFFFYETEYKDRIEVNANIYNHFMSVFSLNDI